MRRLQLWLVFVALLGACREPGHAARRDLVAALVTAAMQEDSAHVRTLSVGPDLPVRLATIRRLEPELLEAIRSGLKTWVEDQRGDTLAASYRVPYRRGSEEVAVTFLRVGGQWRVLYIGFPDRM